MGPHDCVAFVLHCSAVHHDAVTCTNRLAIRVHIHRHVLLHLAYRLELPVVEDRHALLLKLHMQRILAHVLFEPGSKEEPSSYHPKDAQKRSQRAHAAEQSKREIHVPTSLLPCRGKPSRIRRRKRSRERMREYPLGRDSLRHGADRVGQRLHIRLVGLPPDGPRCRVFTDELIEFFGYLQRTPTTSLCFVLVPIGIVRTHFVYPNRVIRSTSVIHLRAAYSCARV